MPKERFRALDPGRGRLNSPAIEEIISKRNLSPSPKGRDPLWQGLCSYLRIRSPVSVSSSRGDVCKSRRGVCFSAASMVARSEGPPWADGGAALLPRSPKQRAQAEPKWSSCRPSVQTRTKKTTTKCFKCHDVKIYSACLGARLSKITPL